MHGVSVCKAVLAAGLLAAGPSLPGIARAEAPQVLTEAFNTSGQALFRTMAGRPGNIVFSPYSIGTAMAMALAGARGETEREMAKALRHSLAPAQVNDANAASLAILRAYDKSSALPVCPPHMKLDGERCVARPQEDGTCPFGARLSDKMCVATPRFPPSAKLLVANALMLSQATVSKDYAALLKEKYAAEAFPGATLDTVNGWVKERTEGKIDKLLDRMSDLVLVNAVYFKSRWAMVFDKGLTKDEFFHLSRSRQELVPTMLQRAYHAVAVRDGYRAIRLPYAVRSLSMIVALPNEVDGVDKVAARIDMAELTAMLASLRTGQTELVMLSLPRFKIEYTTELTEAFRAAGMTRAFDIERADFSGMTGMPAARRPAAIDQIVHRAVIEVQEESTEAAAATAVGMVVASAPVKPIEPTQFRVDRPFLYYIVDDVTGAILFQGRIADPR